MTQVKIFLIGLATLMMGCHGAAFYKDESIDSETRREINALNKQLIQGCAENDAAKVLSLFSEELKAKSKDDIKSVMNGLGERVTFSKFEVKNQFEVKNITQDAPTSLTTGSGDWDYTIQYNLHARESFVTVGYFSDPYTEFAITTIYGKRDGKWKLDIFNIGPLTCAKKNAVDWYYQAQAKYKKGYMADAAIDMGIAMQLLHPGLSAWQYTIQDKIENFYGALVVELKKTQFPITVSSITSQPKIVGVHPQNTDKGVLPMVNYITSLNIDDSVGLNKECNQIHGQIGSIFFGLDKDKEEIMYRAYNNDTSRYFGMIRKY